MKTAIITDSRYAAHTNPTHVERKERLDAIVKSIGKSAIHDGLLNLTARAATYDEVAAVHLSSYLDSVKRMADQGGGDMDADTYVTSASWEAALWAAGGCLRLVEAVAQGTCKNGFALVRPPGHHATRKRSMGFCLINNIAVAARYARDTLGFKRVAIVDYDVHHGNGTQDIFYEDAHILYCSSHASPFYPGTGFLHEIGSGTGHGTTLNMPLPPGVGDKGFVRVFEQVLVPALHQWKPDLILVSAGYDGHWSDPIGPMVMSVTGYARLSQIVYALANELCEGRIVCVLEGGYNLEALGACVVATLEILSGLSFENDPIGVITAPEPEIGGVIATLQKQHPLLSSKQ